MLHLDAKIESSKEKPNDIHKVESMKNLATEGIFEEALQFYHSNEQFFDEFMFFYFEYERTQDVDFLVDGLIEVVPIYQRFFGLIYSIAEKHPGAAQIKSENDGKPYSDERGIAFMIPDKRKVTFPKFNAIYSAFLKRIEDNKKKGIIKVRTQKSAEDVFEEAMLLYHANKKIFDEYDKKCIEYSRIDSLKWFQQDNVLETKVEINQSQLKDDLELLSKQVAPIYEKLSHLIYSASEMLPKAGEIISEINASKKANSLYQNSEYRIYHSPVFEEAYFVYGLSKVINAKLSNKKNLENFLSSVVLKSTYLNRRGLLRKFDIFECIEGCLEKTEMDVLDIATLIAALRKNVEKEIKHHDEQVQKERKRTLCSNNYLSRQRFFVSTMGAATKDKDQVHSQAVPKERATINQQLKDKIHSSLGGVLPKSKCGS